MCSPQPDHGPVTAPYQVGFFPDYIPMLEAGKKWLTYRLAGPFDYLKSGDSIQLRLHGTHRLIGETTVVRVDFKTLGELPIDCPGHETYSDKQHQRQVLSGYAKRELGLDENFLIIEFAPLLK